MKKKKKKSHDFIKDNTFILGTIQIPQPSDRSFRYSRITSKETEFSVEQLFHVRIIQWQLSSLFDVGHCLPFIA